VLETIQLSGELIRPMGGAASPDGTQVFISTGRGKNVVVIDTRTNKPVAFIEVGDSAVGHRRRRATARRCSRPTVRRTTSRSSISRRAR
jgi:YVTN family beta-propeller protein